MSIRNSLEVIEDEADRLTELIENLLAASKLQAQQMQVDLEDTHLDKLAAQVIERFSTSVRRPIILNSPSHRISQ